MEYIKLAVWNDLKKVLCYYTGSRKLLGKVIHPWKKYDRLTDIPIDEFRKIIKDEKIKLLILDMDGTLKYYKNGLIDENKKWVNEIKKYVKVYIISNANKRRTSKVANELGVEFIYSAKKPLTRGFKKVLNDENCSSENTIMIGDALVADIIGAKKAGINKTILLKDLNVIGLKK